MLPHLSEMIRVYYYKVDISWVQNINEYQFAYASVHHTHIHMIKKEKKKPGTRSQRDNMRTGSQTQLHYLLHYQCRLRFFSFLIMNVHQLACTISLAYLTLQSFFKGHIVRSFLTG